MINRSFTAKALSKAIAYANVGKASQCKAWLEALITEIDPTGSIKRVEAGGLKVEDIEYLEANGHAQPKLIKMEKASA